MSENVFNEYKLWGKIFNILLLTPFYLLIPLFAFLAIVGKTYELFELPITLFLLLDAGVFKQFSTYVLEEDGLTRIGGGIFWKLIIRKRKFFKDKFSYKILVRLKDSRPESILILDKDDNEALLIKRTIVGFDRLIDMIKKYGLV